MPIRDNKIIHFIKVWKMYELIKDRCLHSILPESSQNWRRICASLKAVLNHTKYHISQFIQAIANNHVVADRPHAVLQGASPGQPQWRDKQSHSPLPAEISFMAWVNDESKLSFSAKSSGRYFVSSILIYFSTDSTRWRPLGSAELPLIVLAKLMTKASQGSSRGGTTVNDAYWKDHDPRVVGGKIGIYPFECLSFESSHLDKERMAQLHLSAMGDKWRRGVT